MTDFLARDGAMLGELLDLAAQSEFGVGFIEKRGQESSLSYGELRQQAIRALGHLQAAGVKSGDQLVLFTQDNQKFLTFFWAAIYGGMVPVPVAVGVSDAHRDKLTRILGQCEAPALLIDSTLAERLFPDSTERSVYRLIAPRIDSNTDGVLYAGGSADDTVFIQFSSGSTSDPKGVVLTHRNLLANIKGIIEAAQFSSDDISLSWMPLSHDMGLIGFHLTMAAVPLQQYLMPTELFSRRPLLWLESASEKRASILCSPNFGYKHYLRALGDKTPDSLVLSHVRLIFNGAEPISVTLIRQFMQRMAPFGLADDSMFTVYGLAEATLAVTFPPPGSPVETVVVDRRYLGIGDSVQAVDARDEQAVEFAVEGHCVPGCRLTIVDEAKRALDDGRVGRVLIAGDNVTSGYYRDAVNTAISVGADGWVDTGDLGFISDRGLVVTGRSKDIMFSNGLNVYPHDVEFLLTEQGIAELGKVVVAPYRAPEASEDEVLIFLLYRAALDDFVPIVSQVRQMLQEQIGLTVTHVLPVKRIPKTTSGKVQRRLLVDDYVAGEHRETISILDTAGCDQSVVATDDVDPLVAQLKSLVDSVVIDKPLGVDSNFFDAGISSLVLAEIHQKIDDEWPGLIDIVDLFDHQTINEVAELIRSKRGQG